MILSYPGLFKNIPHVWFLRLYSCLKNLQHDFPKMRGGVKGRLELFQKFIRFGTDMLPLACFDLSPPSTLRLPLAFISCEILRSVFEYRISSKTLNLNTLGAAIKAASKVFLQSKKYNFANSIVELWVNSFFVPDSST